MNKDEFVTCGGVALREVDFRTMESRLQPGLFLAGEVLDIDGLTGGFNFQAAWTTGRIAAQKLQPAARSTIARMGSSPSPTHTASTASATTVPATAAQRRSLAWASTPPDDARRSATTVAAAVGTARAALTNK